MRWKMALDADRPKIVLVWLAFAVLAALGCYVAASAAGADLRRNLDARFREVEGNIRQNLRGPRTSFDNIHDALESMLSVGTQPADIEGYLEAANSRLREAAPGSPVFYGVYASIGGKFYDPGDVYHDTPESLTGKGWYQAALKGAQPDYSGPYKDRRSGELVVSLASIIYSTRGQYQGVLCMNVGLGWLAPYTDYLAPAEGGYGMVVNGDGTILAHPDRTLTGMSFSFLAPGVRGILEKVGPEPTVRLGPFSDGVNRELVGYARMFQNGWKALAVAPEGAMDRPLRRAVAILAPAAAALALLVSFVIARLSRARVTAEEENESKTTFLTRISHEIRTPMNAIVGMSDLLLRSEKDMSAQCRAWALNIKHAGDLLLSIINDILDFSTIRSGSFKFVPLSYTLSSLVNDSINIIMVRLQEKSLVFLVFVDGKLPNYLRGDVTRVRQIILNILSNAVKYTREGYVYLIVKGRVRPDTNILELRISIKDTGIGIKPEDRDKLFADFSRVDLGQNRNVEGTGLGLTITKSLCQMMNGTIDFESTYGLGSTFNVMVPQEIEKSGPFAAVVNPSSRRVLVALNRDDYARSLSATLDNLEVRYTVCHSAEELARELEEGPCDFTHALIQNALFLKEKQRVERRLAGVRVGVLTEGPAGRVPRGYTSLSNPVYSLALADFLNDAPASKGRRLGRERRERILIPKGRILVVDDLETNLQVASALLSEYGCRIDTCLSAAESLELLKHHHYDVVFMDHMMPNMDGVEATRIIRTMENGRLRDLPVIALTANAVSGMKDMFLSHGFNDFISKPIDLNVLEDAVRRWVPDDKIIFVTEEELAQQAAEAAAAEEARDAELKAASRPRAGEAPAREEGRAEPADPDDLPSGFTIPGARILIVDDLPTNVEVARALLAEYGCTVDEARSGAESVDMVRDGDYDLVFMDHMMPGMDGMEAVRGIRALPDPRFTALPIVALTANIAPGVKESFLRSGFDDFVAKPVDIALIETVLARWIPRDKVVLPGGGKAPSARRAGDGRDAPVQAGRGGGVEDPPPADPPSDLVDFGKGLLKARDAAAYRRILGVFQAEGESWASVLRREFPPATPRELLSLFQDMKSSAAIVGADGLASLAAALERSARDEDLRELEGGRYRTLAVLRRALIRIDEYLEGRPEAGAAARPDAREAPGRAAPPAPAAADFAGPPAASGAAAPDGHPASPGAAGPPRPFAALEPPAAAPPAPRPEPELPPELAALAEVDFATGLERCRGAKDRFKRLLGFYLGDLEGWLVMIEGYRKGEPPDLKNATISFHAMKSASATVGATGLSGEAAKLEKAGREEDAAYLEGNALRCGQILEAVRWRIENFINDGAE